MRKQIHNETAKPLTSFATTAKHMQHLMISRRPYTSTQFNGLHDLKFFFLWVKQAKSAGTGKMLTLNHGCGH